MSQSEKFVESIYALSILMLLSMAIAAFYITNIVIPPVYGFISSLIVLLYKSSFLAIFLLALVIAYAQGKKSHSKDRHRALAKSIRIVMLVFVILAWLTYMFWHSFSLQSIEEIFFVFLSLIEIFILEIHNMTFSVLRSANSGSEH